MSDVVSTLFTEQLRPKTLNQAILTSRVRSQLTNEINSPQHLISNLLFFGSPGTGKTTLSRILAAGHDIKVINCSADRGIDTIRETIQMFAAQLSLTESASSLKVVLLEECDNLTPDAWKAMRATMEQFADNVRFIANCNYVDKIPDPIRSRFTCIQLEPLDASEKEELHAGYIKRVSDLLTALQITYTDDAVEQFINMYFPDFRSILNALQQLYIRGGKVLSAESLAGSFDFSKLFELIINGGDPWENYKAIRDDFTDNVDDCVVQIGMKFPEYLRNTKPELSNKIPLVLIACAEHQDMLPRAINRKIVLESLVFKLQSILK